MGKVHGQIIITNDMKQEVLYRMKSKYPRYLGILDVAKVCKAYEVDTLERILNVCSKDRIDSQEAYINGRLYQIWRVKKPDKIFKPNRPLVEVCKKVKLILLNGKLVTRFIPRSKLNGIEIYKYNSRLNAYDLRKPLGNTTMEVE